MEKSYKSDENYYHELKKHYEFKDIPIQQQCRDTGVHQILPDGDLPTHVFGMSVITITQGRQTYTAS
jgi:hypothetical protein